MTLELKDSLCLKDSDCEGGGDIRFTIIDMTAGIGCGSVVVWLPIGMVCRITINAISHGTAIRQEP